MEQTDGELWAASNGQADKVKVIRHLLSTESRGERGLEERRRGRGLVMVPAGLTGCAE